MGTCSWNSVVLPCSPSSRSSWVDRTVEWPIEDSIMAPTRWQYLARLEHCSPGGCVCSESVSTLWCCFSHSQDSWVQESRGGYRSGTTHYHSSDPLGKFLLPVPASLSSAGLQVLVPKGGVLPPGNTIIPLNWKLKLSPGHFGLLMPLNQQARKGITVLAGVTDPINRK